MFDLARGSFTDATEGLNVESGTTNANGGVLATELSEVANKTDLT